MSYSVLMMLGDDGANTYRLDGAFLTPEEARAAGNREADAQRANSVPVYGFQILDPSGRRVDADENS
jgi:hypothetical protein